MTIVEDDVTEFDETETYRRSPGLAPSATTHTHAWSDSCREQTHVHPGGDQPHRFADHAADHAADAPRVTEEWWPVPSVSSSNEHTHVLTDGEQRRHAHAGGAVAHLWGSHTEDELAVGQAIDEPATDPLVEARAWLDSPAAYESSEAVRHLDAVVGYVDDALASLVRGQTDAGSDLDEIPEPRAVSDAPRRVQLRVEYADNSRCWYPVPEAEGWRIDSATRTLVIGRGIGREIVPLDRVHSFSPEEYR